MITIYAIKMVQISDIQQITNRTDVCEQLLQYKDLTDNLISEISDYTILRLDTSPTGNFPVYNMSRGFNFICIPIECVYNAIALSKLKKHSNLGGLIDTNVVFADNASVDVIKNAIEQLEEIEWKLSRVTYNDDKGKIAQSACFIFIYNEHSKLTDVRIGYPKVIMDKLTERQEYKCCKCGHTEITTNETIDNFIPEMYYEVNNNKDINYYCPKCAKKHSIKTHVGE